MAGDDRHAPHRDPSEERLLKRLRLICIGVVLGLIVLQVVADTLGRLFFNAEFHSSELILGSLIGALLALFGIETLTRFPGRNGGS